MLDYFTNDVFEGLTQWPLCYEAWEIENTLADLVQPLCEGV